MLFQQPGQVAVDTASTRVDAPEQRAEPVNIHFDNPAAAAIMGKLLPAAVKSPDAAAANRAAFVGAFPAWFGTVTWFCMGPAHPWAMHGVGGVFVAVVWITIIALFGLGLLAFIGGLIIYGIPELLRWLRY